VPFEEQALLNGHRQDYLQSKEYIFDLPSTFFLSAIIFAPANLFWLYLFKQIGAEGVDLVLALGQRVHIMKPTNRKDAQQDQSEKDVSKTEVEQVEGPDSAEKTHGLDEAEKDSLWWLRSSAV
jgi:hypothetical protein